MGGDPPIQPRKITILDSITRDVLFAERVVLFYRCESWDMIDGNCLVASPTLEDSGTSFPDQSNTPLVNQASVESGPYVELHPSGESQEESSALSEEIPSHENVLSGNDQFNSNESSLRWPDDLLLQKNKLLNKTQNSKKSSNSIDPVLKEISKSNEKPCRTLNHFPNLPTYKK